MPHRARQPDPAGTVTAPVIANKPRSIADEGVTLSSPPAPLSSPPPMT